MRFADAFKEFGAIAEFKRRSPSAGDLRPGGDPAEVARESGADGVLLLLRDLDDDTCRELMLEGDALVEAHDAAELQRAIALDAPIVGVNARDLSTFDVDRDAQLELVRTVAGRIVVAESGIATREDVLEAREAGASAVLVGSTLMRAEDPGAKLKELIG